MIKLLKKERILNSVIFKKHYTLIQQKQIDNISAKYGNSLIQTFLKYMKLVRYIMKQAFKKIGKDLKLHIKLKNKSKEQTTEQQRNTQIRISCDFRMLRPIFLITIMPFSGPLLLLFMYTYPLSLPSWFVIDKLHKQQHERRRVRQKQAVKYFIEQNIQPKDVDFNNMTLQNARKLSQCLYGYYGDGTIGLTNIYKKKQYNYILSQNISKYIIKRKLIYELKVTSWKEQMIINMDLNQKIKWKFNQVINQKKLLQTYQEYFFQDQVNNNKQQLKNIQKDKNKIQIKSQNNQNNQKKEIYQGSQNIQKKKKNFNNQQIYHGTTKTINQINQSKKSQRQEKKKNDSKIK